ncbi:MAG: NAD(P)/FAD-dependent oxidoreductase [Pseudomonadota bacterium]|nr:NAD(P)/FAD-dependent oxidoreductase [Pseudomonadota bacterium]
MQTHEVIVVGGGPAGSSCAWWLRQRGVDVLVLDKSTFPRTKLCAGWITPQVLSDLQMNVHEYPHRFLTFETIKVHLAGLSFGFGSMQHSIRRYEFDEWLLQRSGADVAVHKVQKIEKDGDEYILDDRYRCRYLVGAAGTSCPVYRRLFRERNPRARELQVATLEQEFAYDYQDDACHLWFLGHGLPGYSWYVPKENGYLNVGVGGMSVQLKSGQKDIHYHWDAFIEDLAQCGLVKGYAFKPKGHSYYVRDAVQTVRIGNAFIVGDAAGLASRDLCEGIGPAVRSALLAAEAIATGQESTLESVSAFSLRNRLVRKSLEYMFVTRGLKLARR